VRIRAQLPLVGLLSVRVMEYPPRRSSGNGREAFEHAESVGKSTRNQIAYRYGQAHRWRLGKVLLIVGIERGQGGRDRVRPTLGRVKKGPGGD